MIFSPVLQPIEVSGKAPRPKEIIGKSGKLLSKKMKKCYYSAAEAK
jgi:Ni,Fe-hydrogenase III small subunit